MRKYQLQKIIFPQCPFEEKTEQMYYRSTRSIYCEENGEHKLLSGLYYDFFTYFNSLSLRKWKKYTTASKVCLEFVASGDFSVDLMGYFVNKYGKICKQWIGQYHFSLKEKTFLSLPIPDDCESDVVSFQILTETDMVIYDCYYACIAEDKLKKDAPRIALLTTTFKKEEYVRKNIELLTRSVFSDPELQGCFAWKIIDNGGTLATDDAAVCGDIEIICNKNTGGSGGFARGMMEVIQDQNEYTHVLLMDDDVIVFPDSFHRLYMLLLLQRDEYRDYFVSGAMLEMHEKNIQHEDVGVFRLNGEHGPAKARFDLNLWDSVVLNEQELRQDIHQYAGWWFCCMPGKFVTKDNLPSPFFFRGDDVEFAIRNNAHFLTLSGICIWHEGFGAKFSAAVEFYQVHRNDLILSAFLGSKTEDINVIQRMKELFWQELYKFNYKGADLLLDAVEDYLKGIDFIKAADGGEKLREKRQKDNVTVNIPKELEQRIPYETLYQWEPLNKLQKLLYDYTCNGQKVIPFVTKKGKESFIPYGFGYYQNKNCFAEVIYAVDPLNQTYVRYEKDLREFKRLSKRFKQVMQEYDSKNEQIRQEYFAGRDTVHSMEFWQQFLKQES